MIRSKTNKFRKIMAIMLTFVMLCGLLPITSAYAATVNGAYFDDFSNFNATVGNYTTNGVTLSSPDGSGYLNASFPNGQNDFAISVSADFLKTKHAYAFSIKWPESGTSSISALYRVSSDWPAGFHNLYTISGSNMTFYNDHSVSSSPVAKDLAAGSWHDVVIVTDYANEKANIFVDNTFSQYDVEIIYGENAMNASGDIPLRHQVNVNAETADIQYDNIKLYPAVALTAQLNQTGFLPTDTKKLEVTFNNGMDRTALTAENITIIGGASPITPGSLEITEDEKSSNVTVGITLPEGATLQSGTSYTIAFGDDVKDVFGQAAPDVAFSTEAEVGAPTLTLTADKDSVFTGQSVNLTGTVSGGNVTAVELLENGETVSAEVSVAGGAFSYTYTPKTAGTYNLTARVSYNGGYVYSPAVSVNVHDNIAPTVSITSPADGADIDAPGENTVLVAHASDSDGNVTGVEFYDGENKIADAVFDGTQYTATVNLAEGTHNLTAKAYDGLNAVGISTVTSVNVVKYYWKNLFLDEFDYDSDAALQAAYGTQVALTNAQAQLNGGNFDKTFGEPQPGGRVSLSAKLTFHGMSSSGLFMLRDWTLENGSRFATPVEYRNGKLYAKTSPETVILDNVADDTPYDIQILWDLDKRLADVYVNGEMKLTQAPLGSYDECFLNEFDLIRLVNVPASSTSYVLIDDLNVQTSGKYPVVLENPNNGTVVETGVALPLQVGDIFRTENISKVEYYANGQLIATATEGDGYPATYAFTKEGVYSVKAVVSYSDGTASVESQTVSVTVEEGGWNLVFESDFSGYTSGLPSGFGGDVNGGTIEPGSDGNSVKITTTGSGQSPFIDKSFDPMLGGRVKLECELTLNGLDAARTLFLNRYQTESNLHFVSPAEIKNGGKLYAWSQEAAQLESGKTYKITIIWNVLGKTVDLYLDGQPLKTGVPMSYSDEVIAIPTLRIQQSGAAGMTDTTEIHSIKISTTGEQPEIRELLLDGSEDTANISHSLQTVSIGFAQPLSASSFKGNSVTLTSSNGEGVMFNGTYDDETMTYNMELLNKVKWGETYTLTVKSGLTGLNLVPLKEDIVRTFTVEDTDLKVASVSHQYQDGSEATTLLPNSTIETTVTLTSTGENSAVVAVALYNQNQLVTVDLDSVTFTGAGKQTSKVFTTKLPENVEDCVLKVLAFESLTSMRPLATNVERMYLEYLTTPLSIYMVSDSLCEKKAENKRPETGWGEVIGNYFTDDVIIQNTAAGGRSTKTFINENRWNDIKSKLKAGDYVFVSMGTNDQYINSPDDRDTTEEEFAANLRIFADEARALGAQVIFITPITQWDIPTDGGFPVNKLETRSNIMKRVAGENNVLLLDVNALSYVDFTSTASAQETADKYFVSDLTHLNTYGADYVAKMIVQLLSESNDPLKTLVTGE